MMLVLDSVGYRDWFRFDGHFIDKFLGHPDHPDDREYQLLYTCIQKELRETNNGQTI